MYVQKLGAHGVGCACMRPHVSRCRNMHPCLPSGRGPVVKTSSKQIVAPQKKHLKTQRERRGLLSMSVAR